MSPYLIEATLGDVDIAVAHLHVYPQPLDYSYTVLVVPQVLGRTALQSLHHTMDKQGTTTTHEFYWPPPRITDFRML